MDNQTITGVQAVKKIQPPRKIFEVIIRKNTYDVYDIDGREHHGYGDIPKTWWLYYDERLPAGEVPDRNSERFVPFHNWIKRKLWDVRIKDYNSSKYKWDEYSFSHGTKCELWCNGKQVYEFHCGNTEYAMSKASVLMTTLSEHCYDFFEPERMNGRLIYFYGLPSIVRPQNTEPWNISILPDYSEMSPKEWWFEYHKRASPEHVFEENKENVDDESMYDGYINWGDALSDSHIKWFREKRPSTRIVITEKHNSGKAFHSDLIG
jgi:hypothetical protein